jgi:vancomycin permeability regulator SanA
MKGMITALFLVMTIAGFSQQLTYRSGGTVYEGENKLSSDQVRSVLGNNKEALSLYNSGRSKKTWGNVLFYGGTSLVVANLVVGLTKDDTSVSYPGNGYYPSVTSKPTSFTAAIIGGAMIIASIPIKIGYPKKIKSAISKYNDGLAQQYKPAAKTALVASANQIGLKIEF